MAKNIKIKQPSEHILNSVTAKGKGGDSLWVQSFVDKIHKLDIDKVIPFHNQARRYFDEKELANLTESIRQYGILQPLTVIKNSEGMYEVVSGERRLRAAKIANLERLPCIILDNIKTADEISLVENLHRVNLHPIEFGSILLNLLDSGKFKNQSEIEKKLSIQRSTISECILYTEIDTKIKEYLINNDIRQQDVLRTVFKHRNNIKKIEEYLGFIKKEKKQTNSILRISQRGDSVSVERKNIHKLEGKPKKELVLILSGLLEELKEEVGR